MEFKVNQFTTIKNFKRTNTFETVVKFGIPEKYERFTGELKGNKVTGLICLKDDNVYGLTQLT